MNEKSHIQQIIYWFKCRGGCATLREIAQSGQEWVWEFNARKTDLRHTTNFDLVLTRGKIASDNTYVLVEKEENGQIMLGA